MYDKPLTITYAITSAATGTALDRIIRGPVGATGVIRSVMKSVTTVIVGIQNVQLGTLADADAYVDWAIATLTDESAEVIDDSEGAAGTWKDRTVPADTDLHVAHAAMTSGAMVLYVTIDWNAAEPRVSFA